MTNLQQPTSKQQIANISLLVKDYDESIEFYVNKLGFCLVEDSDLGGGKRWVVVSPRNGTGCNLLLAKASNSQQQQAVGDQSGGRVFLFLQTNEFWQDYHFMKAQGVNFLEQPREEIYATVVVFEDLYGNKWDLLERKASSA